MSPASAASSSPVWKTLAASASDASDAGRLTVGRTIRFQSASTAAGDWPCSLSGPERASVERRVGQVELREGSHGARDRDAVAARQEGEARQRREQVRRRRQARTADPADAPARRDHGDRQATLQLGQLRRVDALEEAPVLGAAAQEDVLAVVHPDVLPADRERRAAEPRPSLEQRHVGARVRALERGCDSRQSPSDYGDFHGAAAARLLTATQPFSQVGSETRPRRTRSGRRSIRPSSRR